jgi:hypothetical protein
VIRMPRTCSICERSDRQPIEEALRAGESFRRLSIRFETSAAALYRHKISHMQSTATTDQHKETDAAQTGAGQPADTVLHTNRRFVYSAQQEAATTAPRVMPVNGRPPGPCPTCGGTLWRLNEDGSLTCIECHRLPTVG